MGSLDGVIEPIYFLITSIGFVILAYLNFRKKNSDGSAFKWNFNYIVWWIDNLLRQSNFHLHETNNNKYFVRFSFIIWIIFY